MRHPRLWISLGMLLAGLVVSLLSVDQRQRPERVHEDQASGVAATVPRPPVLDGQRDRATSAPVPPFDPRPTPRKERRVMTVRDLADGKPLPGFVLRVEMADGISRIATDDAGGAMLSPDGLVSVRPADAAWRSLYRGVGFGRETFPRPTAGHRSWSPGREDVSPNYARSRTRNLEDRWAARSRRP